LQRELTGTKQRIADLEQQLTTREAELSQTRQETGELREREKAARAELQDLHGYVERNRAPYVAMAASTGGAWDEYQERSGQAQAPQGGSPLVATLREKLIAEREQRVRLERELEQLKAEQAEMTSGPFENKMHTELTAARKQVEELKVALATERKARQEITQRFEQLQVEYERLRRAAPAPAAGAAAEEIAALEARQRRVLASIEKDLFVSRQRENELRNALEASQGPQAASLATAVSDLRAQNNALQTRLDDEHRENRELSAKLNLAGRVTELIFKMRNANAAVAAPAP
jgi:hypothetical protein